MRMVYNRRATLFITQPETFTYTLVILSLAFTFFWRRASLQSVAGCWLATLTFDKTSETADKTATT